MKYLKVIVSSTLLVANIMAMSPKVLQVVQPSTRLTYAGIRHLASATQTLDKKFTCLDCDCSDTCPTITNGKLVGDQLKKNIIIASSEKYPATTWILGMGGMLSAVGVITTIFRNPSLLTMGYGAAAVGSFFAADYCHRQKIPSYKTNETLQKVKGLGELIDMEGEKKTTFCTQAQKYIAEAQTQLSKSSK